MLQTRSRMLLLAATLVTAVACGGQSTDTVTSLDVTTYPAGQAFTMFVTLQACRDVCAEYDEPSCDVNVDAEAMTIEVNASVSWDRVVSDGECPNTCGQPVKAACRIEEGLDAGVYEVVSGSFRRQITIR